MNGYGQGDFHLDTLRTQQEKQFEKDLKYFVQFLPSIQENEIITSVDRVIKRKILKHANVNYQQKKTIEKKNAKNKFKRNFRFLF